MREIHTFLRCLTGVCFLLLFFTEQTFAQVSVNGKLMAAKDSSGLPGASVVLMSGSAVQYSAYTDEQGRFHLQNVVPGQYNMISFFIGFRTDTTTVNVQNADIRGLRILMQELPEELKTVVVEQTLPRMQIKGDTIQYNADAYKVNPDATAEDLFKKMPGVTTDGSNVKVNGEQIKKILVDGKPFFNDDPAATLKNMPADMVESMQVFDKQSDQAEFGGFKDGNAEKTLNVRTKSEKKNGTFGKVYGGYGTDDRYNAGLVFNNFKMNRRISVIGMTNNINQQNFSMQDVMSVMSNSGQGGGPGQGGGGGGQGLFNGQQSGIAKTQAGGINYNDVWGKKFTVSGSYFYNRTDNANSSDLIRNYYTQDQLRYTQNSLTNTTNINNRGSLKIEYAIDSMNKIILNARATTQDYRSSTYLDGLTSVLSAQENTTRTNNSTTSKSFGYTLNNDLQYQHRFSKPRRTISLNLNMQANNRSGDGAYYSNSVYYLQNDSTALIDQKYTNESTSWTFAPTLSYTEPLGKRAMLQWSTRASFQRNNAEKLTSDIIGSVSSQNSSLSNVYAYQYDKKATGLYYKISTDSIDFSVGSDIEQSSLRSDQTFPSQFTTSRDFFNVLPRINFTKRFAWKARLNMNASSSTNAPSVTQLQNVLDVSNPLMVKLGNADLKQSRDNSVEIRYNKRVPDSESHYMFMVSGTQTMNNISNATTILRQDTIIQNVQLARGAQITEYVNLNNSYSARAFAIYGFPIKKLGNLNLNASYNFTQTPALVNRVLNYSRNNVLGAGISLGSNISENIDFSIGYNGNYNSVQNSANTAANTNYFSQAITFKANVILWKRFVVNTDFTDNSYIGLSQARNQNYFLWSAYLGYKFGKAQEFELKASCFDILNQNTNIARTVKETYTEDSRTASLRRYGMLTLTYTFKKFKGGAQMPEQHRPPRGMSPGMMPPPGAPPGGG